jgi:SAM-dependent methyltransferase
MTLEQSASARCIDRLRRYPIVSDVVDERDPMHEERNYLMLGRAGLDAIRLALLCAQKEEPASILDFASGYGRVLRFLRAEYPQARIAACDIDHDAVDFCTQHFGAEPIYGREHPELSSESYELIWVGSLFTHLDAPAWPLFFDAFQRSLVPGGLLVFTVHGRTIMERLSSDGWVHYLPNEERCRALVERSAAEGFAFEPYPEREHRPEPSVYGVSLTKPEWIWNFLRSRYPDLLVTNYIEDRWGGQDVIGCVKVAEGSRPFRQPLRHPNLD